MTYNLVMPAHMNSAANQTVLRRNYALAPAAWLITLYIATALTAGVDNTPAGSADRVIFETRHIIMHLLAFALQAWLISRAVLLAGDPITMRSGLGLIGLVLVLGIGQEVLQALYRQEVRVLASVWDLAVDTAGGTIGWWWFRHRQTGLQSQYFRRAGTGK